MSCLIIEKWGYRSTTPSNCFVHNAEMLCVFGWGCVLYAVFCLLVWSLDRSHRLHNQQHSTPPGGSTHSPHSSPLPNHQHHLLRAHSLASKRQMMPTTAFAHDLLSPDSGHIDDQDMRASLQGHTLTRSNKAPVYLPGKCTKLLAYCSNGRTLKNIYYGQMLGRNCGENSSWLLFPLILFLKIFLLELKFCSC